MAFVPATNIVEVFIDHTFNGKSGVGWVLHFRRAGLHPWDLDAMADLAQALKAWWNTSIRPHLVGVSLTRIKMRDLTSQNGLVFDYTTGLPIASTGSGNVISSNVAFSIKKMTGLAGKSFRGRVYVMGMSEAIVTGNVVQSTWANSMVAAFNELILTIGVDDEYWNVLVSKFTQGAPRNVAQVIDVTSYGYSDLIVDTRRDRI